MNLDKHKYLIPKRLHTEMPLQGFVSESGIQSPDIWMGQAINPQGGTVQTPIGNLYYIFWMELFAHEYGTNVTHLIVDEPLMRDGLNKETILIKKLEKELMLESIIEAFGLHHTSFTSWNDLFKNRQGEMIQEYQDFEIQIDKVLEINPQLKNNLITSCVPMAYRQNPNAYKYVVDEITAVLTLTELGYQIRCGHLLEKRLDRIVRDILSEPEMENIITLNTENKHEVLPPTKDRGTKRRIMISDDYETVKEKLAHTSRLYRSWIKSIMDLGNIDTTNIHANNIAAATYEMLLEPIQKAVSKR
jgi:hypothetical protein